MTVAVTIEITLFVTESAVPERPSTLRGAAFVHLLANLLDDVVLRLQESEPAATVRQVVDVVRCRLDEPVHLVDQLGRERCSDRNDHDQQHEVGDADGRAAAKPCSPFDPADERVEREREEESDHDPRQHVPGDPDDLERDRDGDDDQEDAQDRAGPQVDDLLVRHPRRIPGAPDVVTVQA